MPTERLQGAAVTGARLASLVQGYARAVTPAVLEQHRGGSVSSALGVWLLLAACGGAAEGSELAQLEQTLGCPAPEAGALLAAFVAQPPPALKAAIAVWVRASDATPRLGEWVRALPEGVRSGFMPTQPEADAWARRETLGLVPAFPLEIEEFTRIVLASALATRVSWEVPLGVVPASDHLGRSSPWAGKVSRLLWDQLAIGTAMIARTEAAGLVAVHLAVAREDLTVLSVSAAPEVDRAAVLAAALELAAVAVDDPRALACSLYDLPLGAGHSWEISEQEVRRPGATARLERITGVALPSWTMRAELDLTSADVFGTGPAVETLRRLIGPRPDDECEAKQVAMASFTREGFEAAAVTALGVRASAAPAPGDPVTERTAVLRFDHPFGSVAVAVAGGARGGGGVPLGGRAPFAGLPLFTAWVDEPIEP